VKNHENSNEGPKILQSKQTVHYKLFIHIFLFSIFVVPHGLMINDKL